MAINKLSLLDLQFSSREDPVTKLRRLAEELRRVQQTVNSIIEHGAFQPTGALAPGEFSVSVQSPGTFVIQYNDGGTIRTGTITLA